MRAPLRIAVALSLPVTAWPATPRWSAGATVGGGYDDNLNGAVEAADRAGSLYGQAAASAGAGLDFGRKAGFRLAAGYTGTLFAAYPDLSSHAATGSLGLFVTPVPQLSVTLLPRVGWRWFGDPARDAFDLGGGVTLKVRPTRAFALRAGYRYTWANADDDVYDRSVHHVAAGPEVHPARRTYIDLEYALDVGQTVRYETVATTRDGSGSGSGTGTGKGTKSDTFGAGQVAYRVPATTHSVTLDVEQGLVDQVYLRAWGGYSRVIADPAPFDTWFVHAAVGVRLP